MNPKAFAITKEGMAANHPNVAQAAGAAQCAEILQMPRAKGGQDLEAEAAAKVVGQISLGKKTLMTRHSNVLSERAGAIDELCVMLELAVYRDGERRVPFEVEICRCIAATALDELTFDGCSLCFGRGQVRDHNLDKLEGPQPMMECPRCKGKRRLRFNEDQRVENLAREWVAAFPGQPLNDPEAVRLVGNALRKDERFRKISSAVDYAKGVILESERIAVEQAGLMLERWGVEDVG